MPTEPAIKPDAGTPNSPLSQASIPAKNQLPTPFPPVLSSRDLAEQKFQSGDYDAAYKIAVQLKKKSPKAALTLIGRIGCGIKSPRIVNDAIEELDNLIASDTEYLINKIYAECRKHGLKQDDEGKVIGRK